MEQDDQALPLIGQIAKLQFRRGDALVLKTERRLSAPECERIKTEIDYFLGFLGLSICLVPVLLLQEGMELQVIDAQSLVRIGDGEAGEANKNS